MSNNIVLQKHNLVSVDDEKKQFLTMEVGGQLVGISIYSIRDVLAPQKITNIPLSPKEVVGSLNLRGRIVTAIDLGVILDLNRKTNIKDNMSIVVEHNSELYSFIVESVGEVLSLSTHEFIHNPSNLPRRLQELSLGIFPLQGRLLVIIDIKKVFASISSNDV